MSLGAQINFTQTHPRKCKHKRCTLGLCEGLTPRRPVKYQRNPFRRDLCVFVKLLGEAGERADGEERVRLRERESAQKRAGKWREQESARARGRERKREFAERKHFCGGEKNNYGNSVRRKPRPEAGQKRYQCALSKSQFTSFHCCVYWGFNLLQPAWVHLMQHTDRFCSAGIS